MANGKWQMEMCSNESTLTGCGGKTNGKIKKNRLQRHAKEAKNREQNARQTDREIDRYIDRKRDRQIDGQTDWQTDRQTDCQIDRQNRLLVCPRGHRWLNTFSLYFVGFPERQNSRAAKLVRVACSSPTHFHFFRLLLKSHKNVINLRVIVQSSRQARSSFFWLNWIIIYFNWQKANATAKTNSRQNPMRERGGNVANKQLPQRNVAPVWLCLSRRGPNENWPSNYAALMRLSLV